MRTTLIMKKLPIITAPNKILRKVAKPVAKIDKKVKSFIDNLLFTLEQTSNPKGVGLAAPQVGKSWRIFALNLSTLKSRGVESIFINPQITRHSANQTLGPDPKKPTLEGCLSMPNVFGPVPRWEWVELTFQDTNLDEQTGRFADFEARVIQHELDHLDGILFTDHSLKHNLPVYQDRVES